MHISVVVNVKEIKGNMETLAKDKRQRIESRHTDNWQFWISLKDLKTKFMEFEDFKRQFQI